ncbi:MAG: HK97 family phage prohead protease, partial [Oscillospiraceae bacterium]|nr:HK97 family phage prohead protease [Oscillospiraceae bacterium]
KDSWEDIDTDYPKRTIQSIRKVFEVSAVVFPAYEGTDIQAASEGDPLDSVKASLESARKQAEEDRAAAAEQERRTALLERLEKLTKEGRDE